MFQNVRAVQRLESLFTEQQLFYLSPKSTITYVHAYRSAERVSTNFPLPPLLLALLPSNETLPMKLTLLSSKNIAPVVNY